MRVAVSIPDPVFSEAELLVKRLKTTRSDVYARVLDAFIGAHATDRLTQTLSDVVDAVAAPSDVCARRAAQQVLDQVEW